MFFFQEDDEEGLLDADEDEEQVQANEAANKKFPLAHRFLDEVGFKNNSYLESTLFSANEVSGLVQMCTTFSGWPRWGARRWRAPTLRQCSAARGVSA